MKSRIASAVTRPISRERLVEFAFVLAAVIALVPLDPASVRPGLDPSWQQVLHVAFQRGMQFGSDLVFTYGPFGFAHVRAYWPGLFGITLFYWSVIALRAGTVDLYAFDQAVIFAHGFKWNPRPVFQSYTYRGNGWVELPRSRGLRTASFRLERAAGLNLESFIRGPGIVFIELMLRGEGPVRSYRYIPRAAQEPFLFWPAVFDTAQFAQLFAACGNRREIGFSVELHAIDIVGDSPAQRCP